MMKKMSTGPPSCSIANCLRCQIKAVNYYTVLDQDLLTYRGFFPHELITDGTLAKLCSRVRIAIPEMNPKSQDILT